MKFIHWTLSLAALFFSGLNLFAVDETSIAEKLGSKADAMSMETNDQGEVVSLALSNLQSHRKAKDKAVIENPGITDADLAELLQLTALRSLFLEKQALSAEGYAQLTKLPHLEDLRIHYPGDRFIFGHHDYPPIQPDFAVFVDRLSDGLRHLELKHGFDVKGDGGSVLAALNPRPNLEKLELDTSFATSEALPFILSSPELVDLQLHRTSMTDSDMQQIFAALPKLRILELRPLAIKEDPISPNTLRGLKDHGSLERIYMNMNWGGPMTWEGGLEYLATIPSLKLISLGGYKPRLTADDPAIVRFHQARPDVSINLGSASENINAGLEPYTSRDLETTWGITK